MLLLPVGYEVLTARNGNRGRLALRLAGVFASIFLVSTVALWAFYGFRYAAWAAERP